jgi:hypothetical protein
LISFGTLYTYFLALKTPHRILLFFFLFLTWPYLAVWDVSPSFYYFFT